MRRKAGQRAEQFEPAAGRQAQLDHGDVRAARHDAGERHRVILRFADHRHTRERFEQRRDAPADRDGRFDDVNTKKGSVHAGEYHSRAPRMKSATYEIAVGVSLKFVGRFLQTRRTGR
ncbi:hypothetical protein Bpla01_62300 [Burkholderia plantarii]|nr:hypothetical protein Bpla01_62300 [Burkholderia plantarii]